jgi:hypothetical protein
MLNPKFCRLGQNTAELHEVMGSTRHNNLSLYVDVMSSFGG